MKREYISPSTSVIEFDSTGMLCAASGIEKVTPKIDSADPVEWPVHNDPYSEGDGDII